MAISLSIIWITVIITIIFIAVVVIVSPGTTA
jgi:hypothetical protein